MLIYSLILFNVTFSFFALLWRSRRIPGYRQGWAERLGYCPFQLEKSIWVHAVSVGETIAALPLIKQLINDYPHLPVVITNMTPTGAARVKSALKDSVKQVFIPYDIPNAVNRFLKKINPQIAIIMETELWPNLFACTREHKIPLVVLNARLSQQSAAGYARIPGLTRGIFQSIHRLAAQTSSDAERFIQLGLEKEKITVTGNLKFDLEIPSDLTEKSQVLQQQLGQGRLKWIAASTHQGEEEIMLAAHRLILNSYPDALLILVPRHPERFDKVSELAKQTFNVVRRSSGESCAADTQVYLGDTMGEMLLLYSAVDVALVAGSFIQVGGHNMLEPAALHKPVLTGPVLFNFVEISRMLIDAKGMNVVNSAEEIAQALQQLFANESYRYEMGECAYQVVAANKGSLQKQINLIKQIL